MNKAQLTLFDESYRVAQRTPRLVNIRETKDYDLYIGREMPSFGLKGSKWGNPFKLEDRWSSEERLAVLKRYADWVVEQESLMSNLGELTGCVLACWCKPKLCHGEVLIRLWKERIG